MQNVVMIKLLKSMTPQVKPNRSMPMPSRTTHSELYTNLPPAIFSGSLERRDLKLKRHWAVIPPLRGLEGSDIEARAEGNKWKGL